ncbi:hypothetical protein ACMA46_06520 [Clavibacter sp. Sh2141]|uniref:hypothetical protein n=1 Tax=Clavibacter sp. Sh2141 TaxID=3395374 RepID=UPI0039BD3DC9
MNGWRRLETAPLGVMFLLSTAIFFVMRTVFDAFAREDLLDPLLTGIRLVTAMLFGALMAFVLGRQRRRSGGTSTNAEIQRAMTTGRLPADADPAVWMPALEWRRAQLRRSVWALIPLAAFVLLGIVIVLTDPATPTGWLVLVVFLAVGAFSIAQTRRAVPRVDDLLRQLRAGDGGRPPVVTADADPSTRP